MKKTFDCVDMKRRGAEQVRKATEGMTVEQEAEFWRKKTEEMRVEQRRLRRTPRLRKSA